MQKYRKRPVVIEAIQWPSTADPASFAAAAEALSMSGCEGKLIGSEVHIETLEGVMTASAGDYIIKGIKGEFYPCKPDIFEATYDAVEG